MARIKHVGVRLTAAEFLRVALAAEASDIRPAARLCHLPIRVVDPPAEAPTRFQAPPPASPGSSLTRLTRTVGTRFTDRHFAALSEHALACGLPVAATGWPASSESARRPTPRSSRPLSSRASPALRLVRKKSSR
jgi:hypothetical protein